MRALSRVRRLGRNAAHRSAAQPMARPKSFASILAKSPPGWRLPDESPVTPESPPAHALNRRFQAGVGGRHPAKRITVVRPSEVPVKRPEPKRPASVERDHVEPSRQSGRVRPDSAAARAPQRIVKAVPGAGFRVVRHAAPLKRRRPPAGTASDDEDYHPRANAGNGRDEAGSRGRSDGEHSFEEDGSEDDDDSEDFEGDSEGDSDGEASDVSEEPVPVKQEPVKHGGASHKKSNASSVPVVSVEPSTPPLQAKRKMCPYPGKHSSLDQRTVVNRCVPAPVPSYLAVSNVICRM